jgi:hypothetical protein
MEISGEVSVVEALSQMVLHQSPAS